MSTSISPVPNNESHTMKTVPTNADLCFLLNHWGNATMNRPLPVLTFATPALWV